MSEERARPRDRVGLGRIGPGLLDVTNGWAVTLIAFIVIVIVPISDSGLLTVFGDGLILLTMCYAWNLVGGYLGELSFGHMIFWALGGYGTIIGVNRGGPIVVWILGLLVLAAFAGVVMALLVRWAGVTNLLTLAIFTLVLGQIAESIVRSSKHLGGVEGMTSKSLPNFSPLSLYFMLVAVCGVAALANLILGNSGIGRRWLAIRDDVDAARVVGINVFRYRLLAYAASASLFALGGAYQSYYSGFAIPDVDLAITPLILVLLAVFIGGPGTSMGPLLGFIGIYGLQAWASSLSTSPNASLYAQLVEFAVALALLRFVLPRLKGLTLSDAVGRIIERAIPATAQRDLVASAMEISPSTLPSLDSSNVSRDGLELANVYKSFGTLQVLKGVSFRVSPGEVVGVIGPNGAGKSTLCNLISGLEALSSGSIRMTDVDITRYPPEKRASLGIGRSFQTPRLFRSLTLAGNVSIGHLTISEREAAGLLAGIGVDNALRRGGDDSQFYARRLAEAVKATSQGHTVLLLDEPLAGLTAEEQQVVLDMARHAADNGAAVIIVEHLIPVLSRAVDRMVALANGRVVADGPPSEVLMHPEVIGAYLGMATTDVEANS